MGGVDKIDFVSLYRIRAKTRKWPVRVIFHFLDLALANLWLEYQEFEIEQGTPNSNTYDLLAFRNEVGLSLIQCGLPERRSVGRPRSSTDGRVVSPTSTKQAKVAVWPVDEVRFNLVEH